MNYEGSFVESGRLTVAAQRSRRDLQDLIDKTSNDGVIVGTGTVNANLFESTVTEVAFAINDYSVLAATQGYFHHKKLDRILSVAHYSQLPVIMFTEGGGGRPGDTDVKTNVAGLEVPTFSAWAALDTLKISVNRGYCFAGNALLFGCADIRVATKDSSIGMAGPAMIEGGGLGKFAAEEIGPADMHAKNGAIDFLVENEDEAIAVSKKLLGYFQGSLKSWQCEDQGALWDILPEDRRFSYDIRKLIDAFVDQDSFLEFQQLFGRALVCGFARIEGRPFALIANDTRQLGGALDRDASTKGARFFELCEKTGIGIISLCDTPGFMVGPDSEREGSMSASAKLMIAGARLSVPLVCIVIRKAYGLGVMAMAGGDLARPVHTAAWPTGEFGGMGLEGAVNLGFKKELDAASSPEERAEVFEKILAMLYEKGSATETASFLEIDSVINPGDTRKVVLRAMAGAQKRFSR